MKNIKLKVYFSKKINIIVLQLNHLKKQPIKDYIG